MIDMEIFPKERVWIPSPDGSGKFYQRSVQEDDKNRRSLVMQLLSRPILPRGARLSREQEVELMAERVEIRKELDKLPKPWELED